MLWKKNSILIRDIVIVVAGVAIVWLGLRLAFDLDNPFYVVASTSMVPTLDVNDVLVVRNGDSWEELEIGDIIVFDRPDGEDKIIVHRIVEISDDNGERVVRTKGDANPNSIAGVDYPITNENHIGKVIYVVAGAGIVTKVISPPVNYIIIAAILIALFFSRKGKKKNDSSHGSPGSGSP